MGDDKYNARDYKAAIKLFTVSLQYQHQDMDTLIDRAWCYYNIGEYSPCIQVLLLLYICQTTHHHYLQDCEEIITLDTTTKWGKWALLLKADALRRLGKMEEAISFYNRRLSMEPDCERAKEGIKACQEIFERK